MKERRRNTRQYGDELDALFGMGSNSGIELDEIRVTAYQDMTRKT